MNAKDIERQFSYKQILSYNTKLKGDLIVLKQNYNTLKNSQEKIIQKEVTIRTKTLTNEIKILEKQHDYEIKDKDAQIEALKKEIAKMSSIMNNDSTNSGIPTSKTKIGIKKYIPNTREKTDKLVGGQIGHVKHKLKAFSDNDASEIIEVNPETCPSCGAFEFTQLDTSIDKCETDFDVKVIKRKYKFKKCSCNNCGNKFHAKIPMHLKDENQYGTTLQSLAVCLTNEIYTPFNKVVKLVSGITENEINMSEGYVVKLQPKASKYLEEFIIDLKKHIINSECYGWDDGVISINTNNAILRTYCTDQIALFIAHDKKDEDSLDEDGILINTPSSTIVMHDHILHNYNEKYLFENVECMIHLIRRLNKMQNNTKHEWCNKLKKLLANANADRNTLIKTEANGFDILYLDSLNNGYDEIVKEAYEENDNDTNNYFFEEELRFLKDLEKYKKNYLLWCYNFNIPSTNNNSERNIRPIKSKQKISGGFKNIEYAKYYAIIRSYIESCKRNGINIIEACIRLMEGNPYSLTEILNNRKND